LGKVQSRRPKKSLGQNFLIDENIARNIIRELHPQKSDRVLEIGPGRGALTKYLKDSVGSLIAVEIDNNIAANLLKEFPDKNVEIKHEDILNVSLFSIAKEYNGRLRVVGNIPYHLTSSIIFKVMDEHIAVSDLTIMVQREVARRITAKPNTKDYGILSVLTQFHGNPHILFDVSPNCFFPKPKVISTVVNITIVEGKYPPVDESVLRTVVKTTFGKRRKTIRNSLKFLPYDKKVVDKILNEAGSVLDQRPEDLTVDNFVDLSLRIENYLR
jgi:16S rRNA (adenine1518-N6/adenine1519-N6)-dimethyltransferase